MCKVSIVIPVFNAEKYIEKALKSLIDQSYGDFEILCVDDGSTDRSLYILREYESRDDRIHVFENHVKSTGAALARNMGLDKAVGKYLLFLDADDWFEPDLLKKTVERAEKTCAQIVIYDLWKYDEKTGKIEKNTLNYFNTKLIPDKMVFSYKDVQDRQLFYIKNGVAWNMLVQKEFVEKRQIRFFPALYDDDVFTYECLACAERISAVKEKLITYRVNVHTSQSSSRTKFPLDGIKVYNYLKERLILQGVYAEIKRTFRNRAISDCRVFLLDMQDFTAFEQLFNSLKNGGLEGFDFRPDTPKEEFLFLYQYEFAKAIMTYDSAGDYALSLFRIESDDQYQYKSPFIFPADKVNKSDKIILYGAGNMGMSYFIQCVSRQLCDVAAWVDRNSKEKKMPVQPVEIISSVEYDKILIAINNLEVKASVKEELLKMGIPEEQIL